MRALARRDDVDSTEIVTRLIDDMALGQLYAVPHEDVAPGLRITRIDSGNRAYLSKEALAADRIYFTQALIAELKSRDTLPDVIHAHFADAAAVAIAIRRELGIPFIYTAHSLGIDKLQWMDGAGKGMTARLAEERAAITAADAIVGSSRDECERQIPAYDTAATGSTHRITPGIELAAASAADVAAARSLIAPFLRYPDKPVILAISRPVRKKNLAGLIEAYANSAMLRERANLVILPGLRRSVSDGETEQVSVMRELVDLIDRHDLHGLAAWPRQHSQQQVRGLYALARQTSGIFVNPAFIEPFGLTILEAAAQGLPVVATRNGGPVDIVGDIGHGLLVDPCSTGSIAEAIERLLTDKVLWTRSSRNALERSRNISWTRYAAGLMAVARLVTGRENRRQGGQPKQRLLLCDIDNTLTGCRHSARALASRIRANPELAFGVATGRSLTEARRLIREWDLPAPDVWITSVGSEVYWPSGSALRLDADFERSIAVGWTPAPIAEFVAALEGVVPQAPIEQRAYKRSYFASRENFVALAASDHHALAAARIIFSHGRMVDILPKKAGKGAAMRHVARTLGLNMDNVIVAGDSGNDRDMILGASRAILVANAEPEMIKLAERKDIYLARADHAAGVSEGLDYWLARPDDMHAGIFTELTECAA